ncbi:restriction endonuclease subunit S [Meridianimaribacter flavus]
MVATETKIQRYDSYKDSGVEWLGDIPKHWQVKPGFTILFESKEKNTGFKENTVLSLSYGNVIIKPEEKLTGLVPESFETYQLVEPGDIIIRPTDLQNDKTSLRTGLAKDKGIITSAYINLRILKGYSNKYFHYYLHTIDINKVIYGLGSGLRQNISFEDFKRFPFPFPPLPEQTAIAQFLDDKTTKIDQAIAIKQQQIALLKERKQILIHKAVTKGVTSSAVEMKDSGVEWIGEIPEHWEVSRLGLMLTPYSVKNVPNNTLLSITRELGVIVRDLDDLEGNHNFIPDDLSGYKLLEKGDFGMNKMKAWQGSYGVSNHTGIVSPAYFTFKIISTINPDFFHLAIRTKTYVSFFGQASDGVRIGQWDLSKERMKQIPFIIPSLKEQEKIVSFVETASAKIETAISLKEQEIIKLEEFKSSLINSVVTGKIKIV